MSEMKKSVHNQDKSLINKKKRHFTASLSYNRMV